MPNNKPLRGSMSRRTSTAAKNTGGLNAKRSPSAPAKRGNSGGGNGKPKHKLS